MHSNVFKKYKRGKRLVFFLFFAGLLALASKSARHCSGETFEKFARCQALKSSTAVEPALKKFLEQPDVSSLYELRRSIRVLSSAMDSFYQAYPQKQARNHRHTLIEIDTLLGDLRDLDVIIELLEGPFQTITGAAELLETARKERAVNLTRVMESMKSNYSQKIYQIIEFIKSPGKPDDIYVNLKEFWELPLLQLVDEDSSVMKTITDYRVTDIREHGYSPPSQEALHILRAKIRGLMSMLDFVPQKESAPIAGSLIVLEKATKKLGRVHDMEILLKWLDKKVSRDSEIYKTVTDNHSASNETARQFIQSIGNSSLLEELITRWPDKEKPVSFKQADLDALREHASKIHFAAVREHPTGVLSADADNETTEFSFDNLPAGFSIITLLSAFRHFRPELEKEGWIEIKPGLVGIDHARMKLYRERSNRPSPRVITSQIEYLDEPSGKGISKNLKAMIDGVKHKQKNPVPPAICAMKSVNMEGDILASRLFQYLGFTVPEIFTAYIRNTHGDWEIALFSRWLDEKQLGEKFFAVGELYARQGKEDFLARLNVEQYFIMRAVDVLIGNWDRHTDNWLITESGKVIPIDHDLAFVANSLLTSADHTWYVNFTADISTAPDFSPNVYIDAKTPVGCAPANGAITRILRREKLPIFSSLIKKHPAGLIKAAKQVTEKLTPEYIQEAVDDIPLVIANLKRRKELMDILISRRKQLLKSCTEYLSNFGKTESEAKSVSVSSSAESENILPPYEVEKKYWFCHSKRGEKITDTYYKVGDDRSMRIRRKGKETFIT